MEKYLESRYTDASGNACGHRDWLRGITHAGGVVTGLLDNNDINATQSWFVLSSFVATLILYVIMLLASTWGMLIFLGIRFYRSMYTDEGYLSHTLPVTANQLFLSKVLVSGVWYLFITIGIGISVVALIVSLDDRTFKYR